jgi:tetratricopeptide (TPR) repeat protein
MDDIHLSREILRAVEQGRLPQSFVQEIATEHLLSRCPHCRLEVEAFEAERRGGTSALRRFSLLVTTLLERIRSATSGEQNRAERDLQDLLALPSAERAQRITRARGRFRGPVLVKLLLEDSRRCIPSRADEAFRLAELARQVANWSPRWPQYFDLYALSTAYMANACRVSNDRPMADQLFTLSRQIITEHGVTDPEIVARVDDLLGSLRKDQRRFREAEKLLTRAAAQFGLIQASDDAARALINLGDTYQAAGSLDHALEATRSALRLLGDESDPWLLLCGHYNLALQLVLSGRYEEADNLLEEEGELYRRFPEPWTQLRLLWLRGDIAAGRGDLEAAERLYIQTRDGFIAQRIGYDAAIVSLDLAILYLGQGHTMAVRRIAEEMIPIFAAQDVHREALAALALFQEAARQDQLTMERALEVVAYLRDARSEPELRFGWRRP